MPQETTTQNLTIYDQLFKKVGFVYIRGLQGPADYGHITVNGESHLVFTARTKKTPTGYQEIVTIKSGETFPRRRINSRHDTH